MTETIISSYTLRGLAVKIKFLNEKNIYVMLIINQKGVCVGYYTKDADFFDKKNWDIVASAFIDGYINGTTKS